MLRVVWRVGLGLYGPEPALPMPLHRFAPPGYDTGWGTFPFYSEAPTPRQDYFSAPVVRTDERWLSGSMTKKYSSMDYNPSSDASAIEILWREQQAVVDKRNAYIGRNTEKIQASYARGMSRQTLIKIYGADAVTLAIGYCTPEKENPDELV